jgi:hypothetical protein
MKAGESPTTSEMSTLATTILTAGRLFRLSQSPDLVLLRLPWRFPLADYTGETVLPSGWEWTEPTWHPLDDPIWKSYRMAKHADGRLANFERRGGPDE